MSPRVLFAGCRELPDGDGDEKAVPTALAEHGIDSRWASWDDPRVDFAAHDLVVPRATWDYTERREEFLRWCSRLDNLRNTAAVARWNTDKAYLLELAETGVPVVPSSLVSAGQRASWPAGEFVVKPTVGAGSRGAARFGPDEHAAAARHLDALHTEGRSALVQPYQPFVDAEGEIALVYFAGEYSHAFSKAAMLTGSELDGSGLYVSERLGVTEPDPAARDTAEKTLDAAARILAIEPVELLYARVDVVRRPDGSFAVLELELTEPSLGLAHADRAAPERFAVAIRDVVERRSALRDS